MHGIMDMRYDIDTYVRTNMHTGRTAETEKPGAATVINASLNVDLFMLKLWLVKKCKV